VDDPVSPVVDAPAEGQAWSSSWRAGVLLSVAAWLFGRIVVAISFAPARWPLSLRTSSWFRWDSVNYLQIAIHGRTFFRCHGPATLLYHPTGTWCGLATWLPGYPTVATGLHHLGVPVDTALLVVSQFAWLAALLLIWAGWIRHLSPGRGTVVLFACSIFPGAVYAYAAFPVSLATALLLGAVLALRRERLVLMALLLAAANFAYPSAWFATLGLALGAAVLGLQVSRRVALRRAAWALGGVVSIPLLALHDQIVFGRADAFFVLQSQNGSHHDYLPGIPSALVSLLGWPATGVLLTQALVSVLLVGGALGVVVARRRRTGAFDEDLVLALLGAFVVVGGVVSSSAGVWTRSILLAVPAVLCLRRLPRWTLGGGLVAMALLAATIARYFFDGRII